MQLRQRVDVMGVPSRPLLRWHGGKWLLAPWIISHFPDHQTYVEPFGGAASVLMRKDRSHSEVYNDLDDDVVNLFEVLRNRHQAEELKEALRLTPFAYTEFQSSYNPADCEVERARKLIVRTFMGFGSNGAHKKTGFRSNSNRSGTTPARDWANYPDALAAAIERLRGVIVTKRDAREVMAAHDGDQTLHYVDPPYVAETRYGKGDYAHELSNSDHINLLQFLRGLKGRVVLSGYPCELYDKRLSDWWRVERKALADGARARTEVLWMNFDADQVSQPLLFAQRGAA